MESLTATQLCLRADAEFPLYGTDPEKLNFLVRYANLSPSFRASRPWDFQVEDETIVLHLDRSRARRVHDPELRELMISCGSALEHLCVAARKFGLTPIVTEKHDKHRLATIQLGGPRQPEEQDTVMFYAIHKWLNVPQPFRISRAIPEELMEELSTLMQGGSWIHFAREKGDRKFLAELIEEGDVQFRKSNEEYQKRHEAAPKRRREDKSWRLPTTPVIGTYKEAFLRIFPGLKSGPSAASRIAESATALAVLGSMEDTPSSWLEAGRTMAKVLLRSLAIGVRPAILNQPIALPSMRKKLIEQMKLKGHPQVIMQLGFPETQPGARGTQSGLFREEML